MDSCFQSHLSTYLIFFINISYTLSYAIHKCHLGTSMNVIVKLDKNFDKLTFPKNFSFQLKALRLIG